MRGLIFFSLIVNGLFSQVNLVPNPSFEDTTACPNTLGQLSLANSWTSPNTATPDLLHECSCPAISCVPANPMGSQLARTGKSYAGIITYSQTSVWREYLQVQLNDTLDPGATYILTYYVSLADEMFYGTNKFGAFFSAGPLNVSNSTVLPVTPQLENSTTQFTNKFVWVVITDTFAASGGEQYLILGNFNNDGNSDTLFVGGPNFNPGAYYYIDDISLTLLSGMGSEENDKSSGFISISPNPSEGIFILTIKEFKAKNVTMEIFSSLGMSCIKMPITKESTTIELPSQSRGIYFVRVVLDDISFVQRIVIE